LALEGLEVGLGLCAGGAHRVRVGVDPCEVLGRVAIEQLGQLARALALLAGDCGQRRRLQLERTLTARTRQLNTRTEALNKAATSLKRSEQDVDELENRQRQLANEKAQVEDARGALELQATSLATIAGEQRQCTSQLTELLNRYAAEDFAWVDANADSVSATCAHAQTDFETFQSQFG
jgi:chromosome segregation ATPase